MNNSKPGINSARLRKYIIDDKLEQLIKYTSFLPVDTIPGIRAKCLLSGITKRGICLECGKPTKWTSATSNYQKFCSVKCGASSKITSAKTKATCLEKYGATTPAGNKEIAKKSSISHHNRSAKDKAQTQVIRKATCIEKYGVEHPMQDPVVNKRLRVSVSEIWNDPDKTAAVTAEREATCIERYGVRNPSQVLEFHHKKFKNRYKSYTLPSGHIWRLQGYEPQALDILLETHKESDIQHESLAIKYTYKNKGHRYYPDFFIPNINTIIEVKSPYTLELELSINMLKREACICQGYEYKFMIIDNNGELEWN